MKLILKSDWKHIMNRLILKYLIGDITGYTEVFLYDGKILDSYRIGNSKGSFEVYDEPKEMSQNEWNELVNKSIAMIEGYQSQFGEDSFSYDIEEGV